jgi:hypothetical protein
MIDWDNPKDYVTPRIIELIDWTEEDIDEK